MEGAGKTKSIDGRLQDFEKELQRIGRMLAEHKSDAGKDFDDPEKSFKDFLEERDRYLEEVKKNTAREFERLKKEIGFSASASKGALNHLREQYRKRG